VVPANGITLSSDDRLLFVADGLGVIRMDLLTLSGEDVVPGPGNTLAGFDGLYWHRGGLVGIQNSIGSRRVGRFQLSADGRRVTQAVILERGTDHVASPTTGALVGDDFYFIENSQLGNLARGRIVDPAKLEMVRIGVIHLSTR